MTISTELAASDFNLEKLNTKQLEQHLSYSIGANSNVIIVGRRGLGKTQISKQIIKANDMAEVYINLSVLERADFGYPKLFGYMQEKDSIKEHFVDYMLPRFFEPLIYGDKKVTILFDEVDKADSSLWAPLLEIVQMHSINGRALPNLSSCIMTANLISEGGQRPILPLLDRAEKYLLQPDANLWLQWAALTGEIHSSIFTFITDNLNMLSGLDDIGENYADQSPRGWHLASRIVKFGEEKGYDTDTILEKVAGHVGKKAGVAFINYYKHYKVLLPLVNKLFDGKDIKSEYKPMEPSDKFIFSMIVASKLANKLDECISNKKDRPEAIAYVGKFMQHAGSENVIAAVRGCLTLNRVAKFRLDEDPNWKVLKEINAFINQ